MMFLSFILAVVSVAHVSAATDTPKTYDTALILKTWQQTATGEGKYDQVVLLRDSTHWALPGTGGISGKVISGVTDYKTALVHRFLEDTGLEKFPKLDKVEYYDVKRDNNYALRVYEAQTNDSLTGLSKITAATPVGVFNHHTRRERSTIGAAFNNAFATTIGAATTTTSMHARHYNLCKAKTDNLTLDLNVDEGETVDFSSFIGAKLVDDVLVKKEVVAEEPVEEPPIVEGPTQAEQAQQQAEAQRLAEQAAANQANANANNANAGNAAKTTEGEDKKDEKKKSLAWLWITLAVVGVLAIAVTAYCCMSGDSTPEQEELV